MGNNLLCHPEINLFLRFLHVSDEWTLLLHLEQIHWLQSSPFLGKNPTWGVQSPAGVLCLPGCSLSLLCLRVVAWLGSLNRLASCKLFPSFSTLVKEFHQVSEEIAGKQALKKMPETHQLFCSCGRLENSLWWEKWTSVPCWSFTLAYEQQIISSRTVLIFSWLHYPGKFVFFKYLGLPTQMKALLHTPFKNLCYSKRKPACFLYLLSVVCLSVFQTGFIFL